MSFDGVFTHAMVHELSSQLIGARVNKIQQPYQNEIVLSFRVNRENKQLLISAHPTFARVQLSDMTYVNPPTPPNFTMSLRKYLDGSRLLTLEQIKNDRVLKLTFANRNELGDDEQVILFIELMGRHSNIILVKTATMKILDTIKHVGHDQNRYRLLMPGADYIAPPAQNLANPFTSDSQDYLVPLKNSTDQKSLAKSLQGAYQGLGIDTANELAFRFQNNKDQQYQQIWQDFFTSIDNELTPTLTELANNKTVFSPINFQSLIGETTHFDNLSELLDAYYISKAQRDRVNQQGSDLIHVLKNEYAKNQKKLVKLQKTLAESDNADQFRIKGEILTTYLHQLERGMKEITLPNFYDNEKPMKITLSNQLTPSKNAQKYFSKYQKLKNAVGVVNEQITITEDELSYLDGILSQIEIASPKDLIDIKAELENEGYLKKKRLKSKKPVRQQVSKPDQFYATDGTSILVGKNNLQNDKLTLRTARKNDIWLHAKNIPGSHVIIENSDPSDETLTEAASLAAYFSKSRQSASVPVDYVEVKKIRKPNGAKPGFVIYEGQRTLFVTPDKEIVNNLTQKKQS